MSDYTRDLLLCYAAGIFATAFIYAGIAVYKNIFKKVKA